MVKWNKKEFIKLIVNEEKNYIGISERKISQRISEHKRSIKCFDLNNAIAKCIRTEFDEVILWEAVQIIGKEDTTRKKYLYENMMIFCEAEENRSMNKRTDSINLKTSWKQFLRIKCGKVLGKEHEGG